ncbi:MAG: hypothetical protein PHI94_07665, partial [Eubacteriaceae bacterium]|nr:hypothetical protein [Eubacteriaceae bacterium]
GSGSCVNIASTSSLSNEFDNYPKNKNKRKAVICHITSVLCDSSRLFFYTSYPGSFSFSLGANPVSKASACSSSTKYPAGV